MSDAYANAFDIHRKLDIGYLSINKYQVDMFDDVVLLGIMSWPIFTTVKDVLTKGLDKMGIKTDIKSLLYKAAPALAKALVSKVPGLELVGAQIVDDIAKRLIPQEEEEKE